MLLSERLEKQNQGTGLREVEIKKKDKYLETKNLVQNKVIEDIDIELIKDEEKRELAKNEIKSIIEKFLSDSNISVGKSDIQKITTEIIEETLGYGPITPLLLDESVSEVMVNGPNKVYVERHGKLQLTDISFRDNDHVYNIIEKNT